MSKFFSNFKFYMQFAWTMVRFKITGFRTALPERFKAWRTANPIRARALFEETYANERYKNVALKRAILYGEMYFYQTPVGADGSLDYEARRKHVRELQRKYTRPESIEQHLEYIKTLRDKVTQADQNGFFSVGMDAKQNKIEASYYQQIMDYLYSMETCIRKYPNLWREVFLSNA